MGLLERIGDLHRPGPTGDLHHDDRDRPSVAPGWVLARIVIGLPALATWLYVVIVRVAGTRLEPSAWWVGGTVAYLLAGHFIQPEPDYDDIGYAGGLIDNPFRWSDNVNRLLAAVRFFLWPGRFVAAALHDLWSLIRPARQKPRQSPP